MKKILTVMILLFVTVSVYAQQRMSNKDYAQKYSQIAIDKMKQYKIPASITLAQGILESGAGGSRLAVVGNNHFGIKCGGNWNGRRMYKNDDQIGDCFRRYASAEESFHDHSLFLTGSQRYASLFSLKITDYIGWAKGLKAAGYATNPQYPQLLIKLIEENELYKYDNLGATASKREADGLIGWIIGKGSKKESKPRVDGQVNRTVAKNNGVKYVIARDGDTFESIAIANEISVEKLLKFNDLYSTLTLEEGDAIYIKRKKTRSQTNYMHEVKKDETIHSISQQYGIELKSMYKMNPQYSNRQPIAGAYVRLR